MVDLHHRDRAFYIAVPLAGRHDFYRQAREPAVSALGGLSANLDQPLLYSRRHAVFHEDRAIFHEWTVRLVDTTDLVYCVVRHDDHAGTESGVALRNRMTIAHYANEPST